LSFDRFYPSSLSFSASHSSLAGALRARTGGLGLGLGAVKVSRTCS
jgi:hypothetical protein